VLENTLFTVHMCNEQVCETKIRWDNGFLFFSVLD